MRIALHNPFAETWFAESELASRICIAAQRLGWQAAEWRSKSDIDAYQPDCVLALHNNSYKAWKFPTYGCMWNPPSFFEGVDDAVRNVLTYDGYLVSSPVIEDWLYRLLLNTPKPFLKTSFFTSCFATDYHALTLDKPRLVYFGSNWDGDRFLTFFQQLDRQPYIDIYGKPEGWTFLQQSYRGTLPFDGMSVLQTLHQGGVGLCLHRQEHRHAAVPSMRIFEIVASGAIALCGDHPFIRQAFGDSVLYIDPDATPLDQVQQITQHMAWIAAHPDKARAMSEQAHHIFSEHYTLEALLLGLAELHKAVLSKQGFVTPLSATVSEPKSVSFVMVDQGRSPEPFSDRLERSLHSLATQTQPNCHAIIGARQPDELNIIHQKIAEFSHADDAIPLTIHAQLLPDCEYQSSQIWQLFPHINTNYFGLMQVGDVLYPNHVATAMQIVETAADEPILYSGAISYGAAGEVMPALFYQPFTVDALLRLESPAPECAWLFPVRVLNQWGDRDPRLNHLYWLYCLLQAVQVAPIRFSTSLTAVASLNSALSSVSPDQVQAERRALAFLFWQQEIVPGRPLNPTHSESGASAAQLHDALSRIAAMESSKFWKLRSAWFRLKHRLGLPVND